MALKSKQKRKTTGVKVILDRRGAALASRRTAQMNRQKFARLAAISQRKLADIEAGKLVASEVDLRKINEVQRILEALADVIREPAIGPWMEQANPAFEGMTPAQVIEAGQSDRIWSMIYQLQSGEPF